MKARYQLAKRKAAELITDAKIKSVPVPLKKIAKHLNAKVDYQPFSGELCGMVHMERDGSAVIGINSNHPPTRRRFTLAHEIGHLVLHSEEGFHVDEKYPMAFRDETSSLAIDSHEIEANQFAAALLMPEGLLREDLRKTKSKIAEDAIEVLARKYEVSTQAMTIRLASLGVLV